MSEENQPKIKTKQSFRKRIWIHMAKEELTNSFRSLYNKIPDFKGASEAAQRLGELNEFKESKLLMVSLDKPQENVIILSLQKEKEVLIPRPRLLTGLFTSLKRAAGLPEEETKTIITRHNIKQIESPIGFSATNLKVDVMVLGSVCVNKAGYRIGDGEGFADLEYAILSKMKAVNENTVVVTTVHDCQILDDLPNELFEPHDVPVDIIVTPTQTIVVNPKLRKPTEIIWSIISKRRLASIPVLNEIKQFEEKEGIEVTLKEEDSDVESRMQEKLRVKRKINKLQPRLRRKKLTSKLAENEKIIDEILKRRFLEKRKKRIQKPKDNNVDNNESTDKPTENQVNDKVKSQRRFNYSRNHVEFSLRLSNISSNVRVRDLKSALHDRGVKPSNITWRGQRGFCYLHFGKIRKKNGVKNPPVQVDSIMANLQQLQIGETSAANENAFIIVEPAEPVTRIEVTDVSDV